jgi:hypothetical protein
MVAALIKVSVVEAPGAKVAEGASTVNPLGAPLTERASGAVKVPCTDPHETATVVDCPAVSLTDEGLAAMVHEAGVVITSVKGALCVTPPPVAAIDNGYEPV